MCVAMLACNLQCKWTAHIACDHVGHPGALCDCVHGVTQKQRACMQTGHCKCCVSQSRACRVMYRLFFMQFMRIFLIIFAIVGVHIMLSSSLFTLDFQHRDRVNALFLYNCREVMRMPRLLPCDNLLKDSRGKCGPCPLYNKKQS